MEKELEHLARYFAIDSYAMQSCQPFSFGFCGRGPDVVSQWDDNEVARRWLMLCPHAAMPIGTLEPNNL